MATMTKYYITLLEEIDSEFEDASGEDGNLVAIDISSLPFKEMVESSDAIADVLRKTKTSIIRASITKPSILGKIKMLQLPDQLVRDNEQLQQLLEEGDMEGTLEFQLNERKCRPVVPDKIVIRVTRNHTKFTTEMWLQVGDEDQGEHMTLVTRSFDVKDFL